MHDFTLEIRKYDKDLGGFFVTYIPKNKKLSPIPQFCVLDDLTLSQDEIAQKIVEMCPHFQWDRQLELQKLDHEFEDIIGKKIKISKKKINGDQS